MVVANHQPTATADDELVRSIRAVTGLQSRKVLEEIAREADVARRRLPEWHIWERAGFGPGMFKKVVEEDLAPPKLSPPGVAGPAGVEFSSTRERLLYELDRIPTDSPVRSNYELALREYDQPAQANLDRLPEGLRARFARATPEPYAGGATGTPGVAAAS